MLSHRQKELFETLLNTKMPSKDTAKLLKLICKYKWIVLKTITILIIL